MPLFLTHTPADGTVVTGTARGDGTGVVLKAQGWRWSRVLGAWYLPNNRHQAPVEANAFARVLLAHDPAAEAFLAGHAMGETTPTTNTPGPKPSATSAPAPTCPPSPTDPLPGWSTPHPGAAPGTPGRERHDGGSDTDPSRRPRRERRYLQQS